MLASRHHFRYPPGKRVTSEPGHDIELVRHPARDLKLRAQERSHLYQAAHLRHLVVVTTFLLFLHRSQAGLDRLGEVHVAPMQTRASGEQLRLELRLLSSGRQLLGLHESVVSHDVRIAGQRRPTREEGQHPHTSDRIPVTHELEPTLGDDPCRRGIQQVHLICQLKRGSGDALDILQVRKQIERSAPLCDRFLEPAEASECQCLPVPEVGEGGLASTLLQDRNRLTEVAAGLVEGANLQRLVAGNGQPSNGSLRFRGLAGRQQVVAEISSIDSFLPGLGLLEGTSDAQMKALQSKC